MRLRPQHVPDHERLTLAIGHVELTARTGRGDASSRTDLGTPTLMSKAQLEIVPGEAQGNYVLRGEIDLHTAPQIAEISARPHGTIILDFAEVTFIDSIGVWAIVNLVRGPDGGTLVIKDPSSNVKRTLDLVGLADASGIVVQ